ncbi:hypothetical protein BGZ46_001738 [Entomortierella lignicola]|nr:hypothetical protein BGZ46_001738 [Entomortierella lignicola]
MATFRSLNPPMGSRQTRRAPDMFSVELELELPQDHFLPAENIQAQVWTNIIHKHNPDGPEVWSDIPMKLSHVIPGKSIAVFAARLQPTGRGDFGLTARWKSHKDLTEWQWAPTINSAFNDSKDLQDANKDVSITVQVPRNISGTSSWTMGPQSVMIFGQNKPRIENYGLGAGVGGPGLYLGNHAAATRARISGYEAVLSLIGDVLDFEEKIPESDKDLNKNAWIEQAQAASPPKRFSSLSKASSISFNLNGENGSTSQSNESKGMTRRSSVQDFMINREPGSTSSDIAAVIEEPVDPPRLTRENSVTKMMVQLPPSANSSKGQSPTPASTKSILSTSELEEKKEQEVSPASAVSIAAAPNSGSEARGKKGESSSSIAITEPSAGLPPIPIPPASSNKNKKGQKSSSTAKTATAIAKASSATQQASPTISSLDISTVPNDESKKEATASMPSLSSTFLRSSTDANNTDASSSPSPPTSAKVITGLYGKTWDSQQALASLSLSDNDNNKKQTKQPFVHRIISIAPGAHTIIPDATLKEAVEFLQTEIGLGKKVLVHCRDGNGRSGSIAVAYIASQLQKNAKESGEATLERKYYDEALQEVWKWKCDVYPHKGLRQSVERIKW